jgi:TP901 family phage tail tape measure protein
MVKLVNPQITIETLLQRIQPGDIQAVEKQLKEVASSTKKLTTARQAALGAPAEDLARWTDELGRADRATKNYAARIRIATGQIKSFREGMVLGGIVIKDMFTKVGFLNAALNILISRFGTMIVIFFVFRKVAQFIDLIKTSFLELDTAVRKVASLVIPASGNMEAAIHSLTKQMVNFGLEVGVSFEQMSDTMFFLASAGLNSVQIFHSFEAAQKLVIATAKDMTASMEENKKAVEILAGLINVYHDSLTRFNTEAERTEYIAGVMFAAFRTQQILLEELAVGLSFAASQAKVSGISIEELVASISVLNTSLVKGSKAGTSYANAIRDATRSSVKLKQLFDIDIRGIGQDFSFLDTVVAGVSRRMQQQGLSIKLLNDLMQVFNIRAVRAVITLANAPEKISQLMDEMKHGVRDMNKAVGIVTDSYKFQQQRLENIRIILGGIFGIAFTGGKGVGNLLKEWGDFLQDNLKQFIQIAAIIGTLVFGFFTLIRLIRLLRDEIQIFRSQSIKFRDELLDLGKEWAKQAIRRNTDYKKLRKELEDILDVAAGTPKALGEAWEEAGVLRDKFTEQTVRDFKSIQLLYAEGFGEGVKSVEELAMVTAGTSAQMKKEIEEITEKINVMKKAYDSYIKRIDTGIKLFDKFTGKVLDFDPTPEFNAEKYLKLVADIQKTLVGLTLKANFKGGLSDFVRTFTSEIGEIDQTMQLARRRIVAEQQKVVDEIYVLYKSANPAQFVRNITNQFGAQTELSMSEQLSDLSKMYGARFDMLIQSMRQEVDALEQNLEDSTDVQSAYQNDILSLIAEFVAKSQALRFSAFQSEISAVEKAASESLTSYKRYLQNFGKEIAGIRKDLITPADVFGFGAEDVFPSQSSFREMIGMDRFTEEIPQLQAEFEAAVDATIGHGGRIINEQFKKYGTERLGFTAQQDREWTELTKNNLAGVLAIVDEHYKERIQIQLRSLKQELFNTRSFTDDELSLYNKAMRDLGSLTKEEEKLFADLVTKLKENTSETINVGIASIESYGDAWQKLRQTILDSGVSITVDEFRAIVDRLGSEVDEYNLKITESAIRTSQWTEVINNAGALLSDLTILIGNELSPRIQAIADTISITSESLADAINYWNEYSNAVNRAKISGESFSLSLAKIGSGLGLVGAVISGITQIANLWRKQKDESSKALSEEFLGADTTRRIAPDFGQARVINQRISLNPIFQFLDASQLSPARQREIAEVIVDDITDLI